MSDGFQFTDEGPDEMIAAFLELDVGMRSKAKKAMQAGAQAVMKASQQMCPVDTGDLEAAHELIIERNEDDLLQVSINVGGWVGGRDVDEYAWIMHELLLPFGAGPYNLGPKSREKNETNPPDRPVGGKFLERAVDMLQPQILQDIEAAMPRTK